MLPKIRLASARIMLCIPFIGCFNTDFASRSLVVGHHEAYTDAFARAMSTFSAPERMAMGSTPAQITGVVYEAATDRRNKLRSVAGADAQATYARRLELADEAFRKEIELVFLG